MNTAIWAIKNMTKVKIRLCKYCGEEYEKKSKVHEFCCPQCNYNYREEKEREESFPKFHCEHCGKSYQLDFDPKSRMAKFGDYKCKLCNFDRMKSGILDITID